MVTFFQRKPSKGQISIERLFREIRASLPDSIRWKIHVSPAFSKGVIPRLWNLAAAWKARSRINHIVGDVHYLALALPRKGMVLTIHDCAPLNRLKGWRRELLRLCWFEWPIRRSERVTTISQSSCEELRRWISPQLAKKVVVIPNCVSADFWPSPKRFAREHPVILQVGTNPNKNLGRVASALAEIGCRLDIVGELKLEQITNLQRLGIEYRALGEVSDEDLVAAYRECDVVVFASLYEGFGLPIVEAQAIGRPVITSRGSAMPEVGGAGALYVDPFDVSSIREGVLKVLGDDAYREQLIVLGFENVKRFQPQAIAALYATLYADLLEATQ